MAWEPDNIQGLILPFPIIYPGNFYSSITSKYSLQNFSLEESRYPKIKYLNCLFAHSAAIMDRFACLMCNIN